GAGGPLGERLGGLPRGGVDGAGDGAGRGVEQPGDHLVAEVQAPERVVRVRVARPAGGDELADPLLDDGEPGEEVGDAGVVRGHVDFLGLRVRARAGRSVPAGAAAVPVSSAVRAGGGTCRWTRSCPPSRRSVMLMIVGSSTGGPEVTVRPAANGAVSTTSIDGLSCPPREDHTSANPRSSGGGMPTVIGT